MHPAPALICSSLPVTGLNTPAKGRGTPATGSKIKYEVNDSRLIAIIRFRQQLAVLDGLAMAGQHIGLEDGLGLGFIDHRLIGSAAVTVAIGRIPCRADLPRQPQAFEMAGQLLGQFQHTHVIGRFLITISRNQKVKIKLTMPCYGE